MLQIPARNDGKEGKEGRAERGPLAEPWAGRGGDRHGHAVGDAQHSAVRLQRLPLSRRRYGNNVCSVSQGCATKETPIRQCHREAGSPVFAVSVCSLQ